VSPPWPPLHRPDRAHGPGEQARQRRAVARSVNSVEMSHDEAFALPTTSWYGIAMALNKRGVPTATGRGIWEPAQVRRVMERLKQAPTPP
jgi:hypothetical protein